MQYLAPMERIKLNLPATFPFTTVISIRITDLNYGGHVGNDTFLSLIHEARQQFLLHFGFTELNIDGVGVIMADVAIEFRKELFYGDEVHISVAATGFDKLGFDLFYLLQTKNKEAYLVAGKAKTGMICYDYVLKKKVPVPAIFIKKLSSNYIV